MAVSPNIFEKEEVDESQKITTKAKSLVVRTNSTDGVNGQSKPKETEPELAEQMNEETKNKYAKCLYWKRLTVS